MNRSDEDIEELIESFKMRKEKSTSVVSWYPHPYDGTIRGPWNRWIRVDEGNDDIKKYTAPVSDDVEFCAFTMNMMGDLVEAYEKLKHKYDEQIADRILLDESDTYQG